MKIKVHGKDVDVSQRTVDKLTDKLAFLDQYFIIDEEDTANCVLKKVGNSDIRVEITIYTKAGILRAEVTDNDLTVAIDEAVDRLEKQIRTQKSRLNRRHRSSLAEAFVQEEKELEQQDIPVRTKRIIADRMSLDEAILQMEMVGHEFFVYTDEDDNELSIVYHRKNGGYGVIDVQKD